MLPLPIIKPENQIDIFQMSFSKFNCPPNYLSSQISWLTSFILQQSDLNKLKTELHLCNCNDKTINKKTSLSCKESIVVVTKNSRTKYTNTVSKRQHSIRQGERGFHCVQSMQLCNKSLHIWRSADTGEAQSLLLI